jgi:ABC-2 type transport system ATP-binding protein
MTIRQNTDSPYVVDVKGMTKAFGDKVVVNAIDMQIKRGSVYGFLGPNGSGKTTFIRMLCGLLVPTAGSGTCLGYDVLNDHRKIKRHVGYMTQRFSYYEDLTVRENLEFVARIYGLNNIRRTVDQALEKLKLQGRGNQLAGTLSGGWKQRLALAACMLHEPDLLLLDEPTAGVDPKARRDFWDEIHDLAKSGLTVMVTTHYMDEAERCTELAYIAYGKLLAQGSGKSMIKDSGLVTYAISGADTHALLKKLQQCPDIEQSTMFGTTIHASSGNASRLTESLDALCEPHHRYEQTETTLEDVFIYLMGQSQDNFNPIIA